MNKELIISNIRHYSKVVKDFTVRQYHSLADFLSKKCSEGRKNGCFVTCGMTCSKYVFIVMNIFYLLMALFMILMGSSSFYALDNFYNRLWLNVQALSIVWVVSGALLGCISIFGIIGALKESTPWTNIYGLLLCITFFLQVITSIAAFCLVATGNANYHANNLVDDLINSYHYDFESARKMDYIQKTFQCCGKDGPSDWDNIIDWSGYYQSYPVLSDPASTSEPPKYKTPDSCRVLVSSYDYENNKNIVDVKYYQKGCGMQVTNLVAETVLIVASVLLLIGVLQIIGMVWSFMLARLFRRVSTYKSVRKFNSQYDKVFDVPTYVDYQRIHNSSDMLDDTIQNQ